MEPSQLQKVAWESRKCLVVFTNIGEKIDKTRLNVLKETDNTHEQKIDGTPYSIKH